MPSGRHLSRRYALDLLAGGQCGVGYLLKQRVADAGRFAADLRCFAVGGSVLEIATTALARANQVDDRVSRLMPRRCEVLSLLA